MEYLESLRACLYIQTNAPLDSNAIKIVQKFINLDGEMKTTETRCADFLGRWIKTLSREYRTMRRALILSSSSLRSENLLLSHTLDAEKAYKLNLRPQHKGVLTMSGHLQFADMEAITQDEEVRYEAILDRHSIKQCEEFAIAKRLTQRLPGVRACDYLSSRDWSKNAPLSNIDFEADIRNLRNDFLVGLFYQRESFRKERQEEYQKAISLNPILLYISSEQAGTQDLIQAVEHTIKNHHAFVSKSNLASLDGVRLAFNLKDANRMNKDEIRGSISRIETVLKKQRFSVNLSSYLNKIEPDYDFETLILDTHAKWETQNSRNEMALEGFALGANLSCFLPIGKVLSIATKAVVKSSCLIAVGFGFNTFFVLHTRSQLQDRLEQLLMSTTARYSRAKMDEVEEKRVAFLAASLFWPIGISPR